MNVLKGWIEEKYWCGENRFNRVLNWKGLYSIKHTHTHTMQDVVSGAQGKLAFSPSLSLFLTHKHTHAHAQIFYEQCDMLSHTFTSTSPFSPLSFAVRTPPSPWPSLFISQSASHAPEHADSALLQGCIYHDDKALSDNSQVSQG